jgi:hypothetical protein
MNVLMTLMGRSATHTLTITGGSIIDPVAHNGAGAGIRFNTDGTIDREDDTNGFVAWNAATDWIIPRGGDASAYEVRCTNIALDTWSTEPAAEDAWVAISEARTWLFSVPAPLGEHSLTCDFEIRTGSSGAAEDSGSFTFTVTETS